MIRVHVKTGLLGEAERFTFTVPAGTTAAALLERVTDMLPQGTVGMAVNGRRLSRDELEDPISDGSQVLIAPNPDAIVGGLVVQALITAAVSFAVNYVVSLLTPKPKPPGVPQERGDESSAAEAWGGVQTNFGQGMPVPYSYGRIAVGGQYISTDVFATTGSGTQQEFLRLILALGEGPMDKIGNQKLIERNGLGGWSGIPGGSGGTIPSNIEVNGNLLDHTNTLPGARIWTRPGDIDQTPLPTNPFRGASSTFSVGERLDDVDAEAIFTYAGTDDIATVAFTIAFPAGVYNQDPQGNLTAYPVQFELRWRPQATTTWRLFFIPGTGVTRPTVTIGNQPQLGTAVQSFGGDFNQFSNPQPGPFEVRVKRITPRGGTNVVDQALWRQVVLNINQEFAYPRIALLGMEILASGKLSGALPQVKVRLDALLVRVWDSSLGFSDRTWDVPAAPFNWMTYPPGRNPAWVAIDFLTSDWGLGKWLSDDDLDLESFRRWSIFCDSDPNPGSPWNEPAFTTDFTNDNPRPAWEVFLKICAAGRATPVMRGNKIGVVYQYRDAHSDSLVSVPAKSVVQLFTSGNVEDVQVTWLPKANRPTAVQYQFINEAKGYQQDVLTVEDQEGALNTPNATIVDQWRPEVIQAYGVVRESQLIREGWFFHRINRLIRREISFVTGPWALAADIGDLIEFEHEILRPFSSDVPTAMQILTGGSSVSQVVVDHPVSGSGLELVVRNKSDGAVSRADINTVTPVAGGTQLDLAAFIEAEVGSPCAVGVKDKITQAYEIVDISLNQKLKREVRALQWVPEVYDVLPSSITGSENPETVVSQADAGAQSSLIVSDVTVVALPDASHLVSWNKPEGRGEALCRVFVQDAAVGVWFLVAETRLSEARYGGFLPFGSYQVAVSIENSLGVFQLPEEAANLAFQPEEFPTFSPPRVSNLRQFQFTDGVNLAWDHLDVRDLAYYEVRVGASWASAEVVYRGMQPEHFWRNPRFEPLSVPVWVAARSRSGLYGRPQSFTGSNWSPHDKSLEASQSHLPTAQTFDVFDGVSIVSNQYQLDAGRRVGTVTLEEFEPNGTVGAAPWYWFLSYDWREIENATVDEWNFQLNSGEARWRTLDTRQASPGRPGVDWQTQVDDLDVAIDDLPDDLLVQGHVGEPGSHTALLVEVRYRVNSVWTPYIGFEQGVFMSSNQSPDRIQFRLTLARESERWDIFVPRMTIQAYL